MRFTANVANLPLPDGKSELIVFDDATPGFGLRVRAGGKRTWIAQYRIGTQQRRITVGSTDKVDFDEARRRARAALGKVSLGRDPQSEKATARAQVAITLGSVAESYLSGYAAKRLKPRSLLEVQRHLRKHWSPLSKTSISSITRAQVAARLSEIARDSGPFAANRARAALSALFGWAIGEGIAQANPVAGTHKPTEEVTRDRVLTDEELSLVWRLAPGTDFRNIVHCLILTGQRRAEVSGMLSAEVHGNLWQIGAERTKNRRPHDVPLSLPALSVVAAQPRLEGRDPVFGSGLNGFLGFGKPKAEIDRRMLACLKDKHGSKAKLVPWRLHDIRRTVATRMADLGVLPHVIEAVLNHVSGHKAGVAGVYNRASYAAEKRAALELWAARVERLTKDSSDG